jgi:hypothetical protein
MEGQDPRIAQWTAAPIEAFKAGAYAVIYSQWTTLTVRTRVPTTQTHARCRRPCLSSPGFALF